MGKKVEKALGKDKGQASACSEQHDDDPNKPPEPYVCTGNFQNDFTELCKRAKMVVVPPVVPRPHRPVSPPPAVHDEPKSKAKGGDKKKQAVEVIPEPEVEPELDENGEPPEPPPKTYVVKDKFEYFKPCVQVEMDHPEKFETINEVFVRGWRVDTVMMNMFKDCWCKMDKLHTINLWHTGLTDETLELLASFVPDIPNLRALNLDNNPVKSERYYLFIKDESPIQHLSLRYNCITEVGAKLLGTALGTLTYQNQKLLTLNLNGNRVGDVGACALADGLRMNRNLLSLCLAQNSITDVGAKRFGEILSRFPLSHNEIVERRKLLSGKEGGDRKSVSPPPGSRRADSRDRPGSVRSSHGLGGNKAGKSAKTKKETKGKEEKDPKAKTKEADKGTKKASMVNDAKGATKKEGKKGKGKGAGNDLESNVNQDADNQQGSDSPELFNPLMDTVETLEDGTVVLVGNRSLLNLNLSNNKIGEDGLKALLLAVGYQTTLAQFSSNKPGTQGLMRLHVQKNRVTRDNETLQKLNAQMLSKDPFYKPPPQTPDAESLASKP